MRSEIAEHIALLPAPLLHLRWRWPPRKHAGAGFAKGGRAGGDLHRRRAQAGQNAAPLPARTSCGSLDDSLPAGNRPRLYRPDRG
jgi:hypothetical protein